MVDTVGSGSFCGTTHENDIDSTYRVYTMHHAFNLVYLYVYIHVHVHVGQ